MVNFTPASSSFPATSPINQHSSLVTAQASEEGCNDDPPPIPQPSVGNGSYPSNHLPTGGVCISHTYPVGVTARPEQLSNEHTATNHLVAGHDVKVHDYGASRAGSGTEQLKGGPISQHQQQISPSTTATFIRATSTAPASTNSSATAVEMEETTIDTAVADSYDGKNPHTVDAEAVATALCVDLAMGLKTADAQAKLLHDGPNILTTGEGITWWGVLLRQVSNSLTLVG